MSYLEEKEEWQFMLKILLYYKFIVIKREQELSKLDGIKLQRNIINDVIMRFKKKKYL